VGDESQISLIIIWHGKSERSDWFFLGRLPPSRTEEQLKEELGGLPEHDFFYFVGSDMSFGPVSFSRAYINGAFPRKRS